MLKKVLLAVGVVLAGIVTAVALQPSTYRVERSITLAAPVEIPFGLVNDFHRWHFWSPWEAMDPKLRRGFDGPYAGPGAIYTWADNARANKGKLTLLEAQPHTDIRIQFELSKPRPSTSTLAFTFQPGPGGVTIHGSMEGRNTLAGKAFSLFWDMDALMGRDLEKGLATLKSVSEAEAKNRLERDALIKARDAARATTTPP